MGMRLAIAFVFAIFALTPLRAAAVDEAPEAACTPGWESFVFASARGSVVRISDGEGWGAGFAWKTPRTIVTAWHVVDGARSLDIVFDDGSKGRARIVAGDRAMDLAILELEGDAPRLTPLDLGDPASLPLGAPVIAIGHPFAGDETDSREIGLRAWTITRGVLGARNDHQIQVDAPINPGNSGGPILDCSGRVLGVVSHHSGTLSFASSPREVISLDQTRKVPSTSFWPTGVKLRVGVSLRAADFTSYGPFLDSDVEYFGKVHVLLRAAGLFQLTSTTDADRVITSRKGFHLYAGAGYGFRLLRLRFVPHVGLTSFTWTENAVTFANGRVVDTSRGLSSTGLTPGLAVQLGQLMFDYKMQIDTGAIGDSAHLFSASFAIF